MFGIGSTELLVILIVALVVLGPKSLPGIAKTVGKVMGEFRRVSTEFQRTMNAEVANDEHEKRKKEAEKELFGDKETAESANSKSENTSTAQADASTAKAATQSTEASQAVVDTVAQPSPVEAAVAKAEAEAQSCVTPASESTASVEMPKEVPVKDKA